MNCPADDSAYINNPRLDAAWLETAEAVRHDWPDRSCQYCAEAAGDLLQTAAFLSLCQHRLLLPPDGPEQTLAAARNRLGGVFFAPGENSSGLAAAVSLMADIDGPPEILASIHRRLLDRKIVEGADGSWKVVTHSQAAKAGGVFYTPGHVAKYIVDNSLDAFYGNDRIPDLLDPSCGCGSFLLAAFRSMVSRQRERADPVFCAQRVLRHIHGVDIDAQAVLVARRTLGLELAALKRNVRADFLAETVRVGNVLCDDFSMPGASGNYDIIVGNPPYRRELGAKELLGQIAETRLGRRWRTARMDLWYYFVHRGLELLRDDGVLSYIVSGYWTTGGGAEKLLGQLENESHIDEIFDLGRLNVFRNVAGRHMIIRVSKKRRGLSTVIKRPRLIETQNTKPDVESLLSDSAQTEVYQKTPEQLFRNGRIDLEPVCGGLLEHIARKTPMGRLGKIRQGIAENPAVVNRRTNRKFGERWTAGEGVFVLSREEVAALDLPENEKKLLRPYHTLGDLGRYKIAARPSRFLIYSTAETWQQPDMFPVLWRHLERFRPIMENRRETRLQRRAWWQLHWPREEPLWKSAKVICVQMAARPAFVPALDAAYVSFSANVFVPDDTVREHLFYFAALLNSRPLWQWFRHHAKRRGVGLEINGRVLSETPIPRIDFDNSAEKEQHGRLVELAAKMLERPDDCAAAKIDGEIDSIVCRLYGCGDTDLLF